MLAEDWSPATGFSPCRQARDILKAVRRKAEIGDLAEAREYARRRIYEDR